mmetsp:Transcript_29341/g.47116  ORF Transcript_29341/g.47116 Transcript_29341/m.47116 type:complete len:139 (+) Transcript_29341:1081-1497(+)
MGCSGAPEGGKVFCAHADNTDNSWSFHSVQITFATFERRPSAQLQSAGDGFKVRTAAIKLQQFALETGELIEVSTRLRFAQPSLVPASQISGLDWLVARTAQAIRLLSDSQGFRRLLHAALLYWLADLLLQESSCFSL